MTCFGALFELMRPAFTAPSFQLFCALCHGWICAPGRRTVTAMLSVGDPQGRRAHDAYHRLFRDGRWDMRWLWRALTVFITLRFCPDGPIRLDVDDTLFRKSGRRVNGAGIFRDPVRSTGKTTVYALGLNLVVVTVRIHPPWGGMPLALPVNVRLHRKHDMLTVIDHAATMLLELASWLPDRQLQVTADGAYASLAGRLPTHAVFTSRIRRDAALFGPPPPRTGRRGRPRTRGDRLPTPPELADGARRRQWRRVEVDFRGQIKERLILVKGVLWYAVSPKAMVRLAIVRDPEGLEPEDFFFSTDLKASGAEIAFRYAGRWAIEVCFRDTKQDLGGENPQCWKRRGPERAACLSLWLSSLVWCWYLHQHPDGKIWRTHPWYPQKAALSFLDALAPLRRGLWSHRISVLSAPHPEAAKITEAVLDTLADAA